MDRLNYLLQRCREGTVTDDERQELRALLISLQRETAFENKWAESLNASIGAGEPPGDEVSEHVQRGLERLLREDEFVKTVPMQKPVRIKWLAAAAVITVFTVAGMWLFNHDWITEEQSVHPVSYTNRQFVNLPDGSIVLLNDSSELTFSDSFGKQLRQVTLSGEGYFDIKHDPSRPFIVHTGDVITKVLGTAFNVKAGENEIVVTVTRGKVEVGDSKKVYEQLTPNQQIKVSTINDKFEKLEVNTEEVVAWKDDWLILDKVTMERAAELISGQFNVKAVIANNEIKDCVINARFIHHERLEQVVATIASLHNATYKIEGDEVIITGGTSCNDDKNSTAYPNQ